MQTSARAGSEAQYGHFHELVAPSFSLATAGAKVLFTTDVEGLNDLYLDALPASERQHHNCSCCRRFIRTYGGLVSIDDNGDTVPVMWSGEEIPDFYRPVFAALADRVAKAKVTGVFLSKERVWGAPEAGGFTHFAVEPPVALIFKERALTARQTMAKRKEDFKNVLAGLVDFKPALLDEAIRIFQVDDISRSEKFVGPLQWLRELHDRPKGSRGTNLLWRAIATAPEGFCHPRSAVTGTLLEDIAAGMSFDAVKRRFEAKVGPLAYQRPQADPTGGAIKAAEALVEKLGVQKSFERRFARLDELKLVWSPKAKEQPSGGMFGHLTPKNPGAVQPLNLPTQTMTWAKFVLNVLGSAEEIEIMVPPRGNFTGILTAEHADAPPILKWDHEEHRNPLSSYVYNGGSDASRRSLVPRPTGPPVSGRVPLPALHDLASFTMLSSLCSASLLAAPASVEGRLGLGL